MVRSYRLGLYEKAMPAWLSWQEKFSAARKAGYDYVELSIDETDEKLARLDMTETEKREIRQAAEEWEIPLGSVCLSAHRKYPLGSRDRRTELRSLEIMKGALAVAADLGIRTIQLAGYDVYYEPSSADTRKRFEYNLYKAAEMAAEAGVVLGFETMETEFMNTTEKAMYYVNRICSPYLQVYPDVGNITNAVNGDASAAARDLDRGSGHLAAVHLKETLPGRYREVPFGTGHVDFERLTREAYCLGVRRFVTEFWYRKDSDWEAELSAACGRMRREFDKFLM